MATIKHISSKNADYGAAEAENEALISEKNGIYTEYREQKARAAELQKVKSNLAAMLQRERTKEVRRDWER